MTSIAVLKVCLARRRPMKEAQEQHPCETNPKQPYTKPTPTKHKPLRDIYYRPPSEPLQPIPLVAV